MDKKLVCNNCGKERKEITKYCPDCGTELILKDLGYITEVTIEFTENPRNCYSCRFGTISYNKNSREIPGCLLDLDLSYKDIHQFYGFYNDHPETCPCNIFK